ncbi:hypothetical protein ACFQ9X_44400 [Catenulispora yoronensis]
MLAALPAADVAAAVDGVQGWLSLPVREYLLVEGPGRALGVLFRHVMVNRGDMPTGTVNRILARCDPDADAGVFACPDVHAAGWARTMILRHRRGPDGRPIIPPLVKRSLLEALADGAPTSRLLAEVAEADDPELVLALLPHARRLGARDAGHVIKTLDAHGLRREAKGKRELWARRKYPIRFMILGFRRVTAVSKMHVLNRRLILDPGKGEEAMTLDRYRELVAGARPESAGGYTAARQAAWLGLRTGSLSPAEILEHTRPAALAVSLADCDGTDMWRPGEARASDNVRALIARDASERLGNDPKRWARVIARVNSYAGTVPELLADPDPFAGHQHWSSVDYSSLIRSDFHAANVLLAMAARDVADRALVTKRMKRTITRAAGNPPLCRPLTDCIIARGTAPQREQLAANEATPDSVLARLIEVTQRTEVLLAILERELVGPDVVTEVFAVMPRDRGLKEWIVETVSFDPAMALKALRCTADDPEWILRVLRAANNEFDEPGRMAAYVLLAEVAGVEAVWALEQERVGTLADMEPSVRASMASGDAEPLIEAAWNSPIEMTDVPLAELASLEDALERPLVRPVVDLIRTVLDGHTERWLQLADLLMERPYATDEELITEIAARNAA